MVTRASATSEETSTERRRLWLRPAVPAASAGAETGIQIEATDLQCRDKAGGERREHTAPAVKASTARLGRVSMATIAVAWARAA